MKITKDQLYFFNGESFLIMVLHGENRSTEILEWHRAVMVEHMELVVNYVVAPFPSISHGLCMNEIIHSTIDSDCKPDYYLFIDNDAIFLKKNCLAFIYDMVKWKNGIWGCAWQSSHKVGPNGSVQHPYASQATLCFSREIYEKLGRPNCDHWFPRSDTAEEITYEAELRGFNVSLMYPSHSVDYTTDLGNGCRYGMGNTYGENMFYHVSRQDKPESLKLFIEKCKEVLSGKFESKK